MARQRFETNVRSDKQFRRILYKLEK